MKIKQLNLAVVLAASTLGVVAALTVSPALAESVQPTPAVGEVSLVLGEAVVIHADGSQSPVSQGMSIKASDNVQTASNGHVHIHFVDDALVSIRPDSRLRITQYDYDASQPEASTIRLNLDEGITRAISGNGARSAKERFRLNTPIAAIGVRGTDFVVSAHDEDLRARVNEGAIIVAPFSADCSADALGPCSVNGVELSESNLQVVAMSGRTSSPQLLPATVERDSEMIEYEASVMVAEADTGAEEKAADVDAYLENVTAQRVQDEVDNITSSVTPEPPPTIAEVDFTPEVALTAKDLADNQLVWGRWGVANGDLERMTLAKEEAWPDRDLGNIAIADSNTEYVLIRDADGRQRVDAGLGQIDFTLSSAQAFYHGEAGVSAMAVRDGALSVDFNGRSFSTSLDLDHDVTGDIQFTATGNVDEQGFLRANSQTGKVLGATSIDGTEAGYLFEQQLEAGGIQGLTLWGQ
ncbi:FecR family protein [Pseudohongiella nitratireducens]|uniref:FecR family protein n=1 Tax=Pseudohongiella nitratireducens TaxID=1768907 RepID=UPI0030EDC0F4|tara:strand:- start:1632 stop:3035 length:1404 start_codon:yes stop_codon:yes gene_type:complete